MNFNFGVEKGMSAGEIVGAILGSVAGWFVCAALLMLGWSVVAPHLNAPMFSYWEWVAIYCGLRAVGGALFKKS